MRQQRTHTRRQQCERPQLQHRTREPRCVLLLLRRLTLGVEVLAALVPCRPLQGLVACCRCVRLGLALDAEAMAAGAGDAPLPPAEQHHAVAVDARAPGERVAVVHEAVHEQLTVARQQRLSRLVVLAQDHLARVHAQHLPALAVRAARRQGVLPADVAALDLTAQILSPALEAEVVRAGQGEEALAARVVEADGAGLSRAGRQRRRHVRVQLSRHSRLRSQLGLLGFEATNGLCLLPPAVPQQRGGRRARDAQRGGHVVDHGGLQPRQVSARDGGPELRMTRRSARAACMLTRVCLCWRCCHQVVLHRLSPVVVRCLLLPVRVGVVVVRCCRVAHGRVVQHRLLLGLILSACLRLLVLHLPLPAFPASCGHPRPVPARSVLPQPGIHEVQHLLHCPLLLTEAELERLRLQLLQQLAVGAQRVRGGQRQSEGGGEGRHGDDDVV